MGKDVELAIALPLWGRTEVKRGLREYVDQVFEADCLEFLRRFPSDSVNLVVTSPPYADNRKKTYGGVPAARYAEWFLPISEELNRVLKSDGSFVLNIKERAINGERGIYVLEVILAMRNQGWRWTEEYIWHKRNCYPGKWPNRFRDAWERCLHFTKQKQFKMFQEAVMVPIGDWADKRLLNLSETDRIRDESKVLSGFGKNVSNWLGKESVYPTNVLHLATECGNRGHSAAFPEDLPAWFIKLFTQPGDVVLDPFIGSGTTALACLDLQRHFIGVESNSEYVALARSAIVDRNLRMHKSTNGRRNGHKRTRAIDRPVSQGVLRPPEARAGKS